MGCFHNFSIADLPLMESTDGLSLVGLQGLLCILAQYLIDLRREEDRAIIPSNWLSRPRILRFWPKGRSGGIAGPWRRWMPRGKCIYLVKLIRRGIYSSIGLIWYRVNAGSRMVNIGIIYICVVDISSFTFIGLFSFVIPNTGIDE